MYLVVGASGFLGSYIVKSILNKTDERVIAVSRGSKGNGLSDRLDWVLCDIADREQVNALANKICGEPVKIVFLAAYHHPDKVEQNPRVSWDTNVTALSYFLNRFENVKSLFYPSTDSVYGESVDGNHFKEGDATNPVNRYGRQKMLAEQLVTGYGYNVVRYPFLIGTSLTPHKQHFYDEIVASLKEGKVVEMFADSYRSSLDFASAADSLIDLMLLENGIPPIINICGDDDLSKYDVGRMIANKLNVTEALIKPVSTADYTGVFQTKRASSTLMDNTLFKQLTGRKEIHLSLE